MKGERNSRQDAETAKVQNKSRNLGSRGDTLRCSVRRLACEYGRRLAALHSQLGLCGALLGEIEWDERYVWD